MQKAAENGVKVYPCSLYYIDQKTLLPNIQLGFAGLEDSQIERGIELLASAWCRTEE